MEFLLIISVAFITDIFILAAIVRIANVIIDFVNRHKNPTPSTESKPKPSNTTDPKGYNDVPYNSAPSELIPQLPISTKPPKADVIATVISSSVPYTYHSDIDLAVKSGKKYASWSMQTALCINNANSKSMNLSVSKPYSNDPHNKWDRTYKLTFDSVIKAIRYAINKNFNSIEIGYDYDGVWQYAGGYWQPVTTTSQKYVDELTEITKDYPEFNIVFTKIDFFPQHRFSKLVRHSISKLK